MWRGAGAYLSIKNLFYQSGSIQSCLLGIQARNMLKQAEISHFTDLSYNSVVISSNKAPLKTLAPLEDGCLSFLGL